MSQYTVAIIKPCAVRNRHVGNIISDIESNTMGIRIIVMSMTDFTRAQAEAFYAEHKGKPFYEGLLAHTTSGPCVAMLLMGDDVVEKWRGWMGSSSPTNAMHGTLRAKYGTGTPDNALHGSDSPEAAYREAELLFQNWQATFAPKVFKAGQVDVNDPYRMAVQLAGCSTAALGWGTPVDKDAYGWSVAYDDVLKLRADRDRLAAKVSAYENLSKAECIKLKRRSPDAMEPTQGTPGAAGWDLYAAEDVYVHRHGTVSVDTGWDIELPARHEAQVRSRSGLSMKGICVANSPGTIDEDYRGAVKVLLVNHGTESYRVHKGDRIAQLVLAPVTAARFELTDQLSETSRGRAGFGSTGS